MEHEGSFFHHGQPEKSTSNMGSLEGELANSSASVQNQNQPPLANETREDTRGMPIACVQRLMRTGLPRRTKISEASKEMMIECVTEFISFITAEANQHCQEEQRKILIAEDLICAMKKLGFEKYAELMTLYLIRYRQQDAFTSPHRVGHLRPPPPIVMGFPVFPPIESPIPGPMGTGGSSGGGSSSAIDVYYDPNAFIDRDDNDSDNNSSGN